MINLDLSIIIPMYNSDSYLQKTLTNIVKKVSIINSKIEILLIDDGSTDSTVDIANAFVEKYEFVKLHILNHHGVSNARNYGIKKARGKYLIFIDSDDTINGNISNLLTDILNNNYDILITNISKNIYYSELKNEKREEILTYINQRIGSESPWGKFYSRSFLISNKIYFDTNLIIGEDALFLYTALSYAKKVKLINQVYYIQGPPHTIGKFNPKMLKSENRFIFALNNLFINNYSKSDIVNNVMNRYKCKEFFRLLSDYYYPLYKKNKISLKHASNELSKVAKDWNLHSAIINNSYSRTQWDKRHHIYKWLILSNNYRLLLLIESFRRKMKGY
ncbi:glycosyltransferase family 2 protein [Lactobacillus sp. LL6]|uniref:glycosyltransferase family 2 protein n=1 Tax=Lactobacillus sp. LL6 TaxID=2596827 RepID=UPI0011861E11|nr:glycosyltransferase family 2 protein [Lactobacillus sp. LL6]TSO25678.1 glycosyltransferase family 2 protein [Lactobacillus sp. LL6]